LSITVLRYRMEGVAGSHYAALSTVIELSLPV
jgi:hypothetical protein